MKYQILISFLLLCAFSAESHGASHGSRAALPTAAPSARPLPAVLPSLTPAAARPLAAASALSAAPQTAAAQTDLGAFLGASEAVLLAPEKSPEARAEDFGYALEHSVPASRSLADPVVAVRRYREPRSSIAPASPAGSPDQRSSNPAVSEPIFGESPLPQSGTEEEIAARKVAYLRMLQRWALFSSLDPEELRASLHQRVISQADAVNSLVDNFALLATGTQNDNRPPSFLLIGPTGVGKNHLIGSLVKSLGQLWGIEVPYLEINGPEFTYPSDINELKGAARGFIRSDEEGIMTSFHKRSSESPFAIILVDEIEKAHAKLREFFLSIMDRGTMTDNRGRTLNFANVMIAFTSNLGYSSRAQGAKHMGFGDEAASNGHAKKDTLGEIRKGLTPEFLNRLELLHFNYLEPKDIETIFDLEFAKIADRFQRVQNVELAVSPRAKQELIRQGFHPEYGARHLVKTLHRLVNVPASKRLKQDSHPRSEDRRQILAEIDRMMQGRAIMDVPEMEQRVKEYARMDPPYSTLLIDFSEGRFTYAPPPEPTL